MDLQKQIAVADELKTQEHDNTTLLKTYLQQFEPDKETLLEKQQAIQQQMFQELTKLAAESEEASKLPNIFKQVPNQPQVDPEMEFNSPRIMIYSRQI